MPSREQDLLGDLEICIEELRKIDQEQYPEAHTIIKVVKRAIVHIANDSLMSGVRDEIKEFAFDMEKIMAKHDGEKEDSWKYSNEEYMTEKLIEEVLEYLICSGLYHSELDILSSILEVFTEISSTKQRDPQKELVDIGNVAMMDWDRRRIEKENQE